LDCARDDVLLLAAVSTAAGFPGNTFACVSHNTVRGDSDQCSLCGVTSAAAWRHPPSEVQKHRSNDPGNHARGAGMRTDSFSFLSRREQGIAVRPRHVRGRVSRGCATLGIHGFSIRGLPPYADVTEAALSTPPPRGEAWTDETVEGIAGAKLNQMNLRFARGYKAFLINAKLWRANLDGVYLSEADLRGANLREALLRSAILDRAQLAHAVFVSAKATGANFSAADMRFVDLSYGTFENAVLSNARISGASLYAVNLRNAQLLRTDLSRTDMRDTKLEHAVLSFAILHKRICPRPNLGKRISPAQFLRAQFCSTPI